MLTNEEKSAIHEFFASKGLPTGRALTFSDVSLPENYSDIRSRSEVFNFETRLSQNLNLSIPIVSANMESVTGLELAVALEREGGLAFPPQSLPIEERVELITRISRADSALIDEPLTTKPNTALEDAKKQMSQFGVRSLIVIDKNKKPVGILSKRDWLYEEKDGKSVGDLMSKKLIVAALGIDFKKAGELLRKNKIEKLPLVDKSGKLAGLITANGLFYKSRYPRATRDDKGRFLRAGSIGVGQTFTAKHLREVEAQIKNGVSILLIDTARAYSVNTEEAIKKIKKEFPKLPLVVGNVSTAEGAKFLFEIGADIVKVGQGPGFVCRTREVGVGVPQLTAVAECAVIAGRYKKTVIADGGIKNPGDLAKALIVGARAVMLGNLLVRARESASPMFVDEDNRPVKNYTGSASFAAQLARYRRGDLKSIRRPEGVTQVVPVTGTIHEIVDDLLRGLASTMAYLGVKNLGELRDKGRFIEQTAAGHFEGVKKA
ncbi:MAG: IMP dehydrogenase [Patescibacteria group bacterium]|nr:IMP dehydrogenase [Patescibacteria group bacterium]MDE2014959.1 IMP dehydrogenase [Patescibacteria group bacterium]MDE2226388.1 IMP dehydrogenase [Patescibacteria group bacterium]